MPPVALSIRFPSLEKVSPWDSQLSICFSGSRMTLGEDFKSIGILLFSWEKVNQQMNVEALTGKACSDLSVQEKIQ